MNETMFWQAFENEDYDAMCEAAGADPHKHIVFFTAADIMQAVYSRFDPGYEEEQWKFADAVKALAHPENYEEAFMCLGGWAEYVEELATYILQNEVKE